MPCLSAGRIISLMRGPEIITEVKKLELPLDQYTVVGSGSLAVRGIREAADIDLVITPELYGTLKASGWEEEHKVSSKREWVISYGPFDASTSWSVEGYEPTAEELIASSDIIEGVNFVNLPSLLAWKKACRREKDLRDIELIETYLKTHKT